MSGDTFGCHNWKVGTAGKFWVEARAATRHPIIYRPAHFSTIRYSNTLLVSLLWKTCVQIRRGIIMQFERAHRQLKKLQNFDLWS